MASRDAKAMPGGIVTAGRLAGAILRRDMQMRRSGRAGPGLPVVGIRAVVGNCRALRVDG